jgi:branched-chain amino acid transport system ATP-binding protein
MALALRPTLLILDEPTQGLAGDEIEAVCRLVQAIAGGTTVLLIEHNMAVVLELANRVTVMDRGRILADGTPREIEAHPEVQRAYLGG